MQRKKFFDFRWGLVALSMVVLTACGGGGGAGQNPTTSAPSVQGTLASGLTVIASSDLTTATLTADSTQTGTLTVSNATGALATASNGQIVSLPSDNARGLPFGLTGRVQKNANGTISILPVAMEDVFKKLKVDFDSTRDGVAIAGIIAPKYSNSTFSISNANTNQTGVTFTNCQVGFVVTGGLACNKGYLEGTIEINHPLMVGDKAYGTLYGKVKISQMGATLKIDYDSSSSKSPNEGVKGAELSYMATLDSASIGIRTKDDKTSVEIPSWKEITSPGGSNIWNENLKIKMGKYFELSGLSGDDKKGLLPLAGVYITPAGSSPFTGDLSSAQLGAIKAGAVVIWIYIDVNGKIGFTGDFKLFDINGYSIKHGFRISDVINGQRHTEVFNVTTPPNIVAPYIKGKVEGIQNFGLTFAADALIGGVRIFNVTASPAAITANGTIDGDAGLKWKANPFSMEFEGSGCASWGIDLHADFVAKAALKASLDTTWAKGSASLIDFTLGPFKHSYGSKQGAECKNSFVINLTTDATTQDELEPTKTKVLINFVDAFNNSAIRNLTGKWILQVEGQNAFTKSFFVDIPTSYGGVYPLKLNPGPYKLKLIAAHKNLKDNDGNPYPLVNSSEVSLTVSAMPLVSFTEKLINSDCKSLALTSTSTASAETTIASQEWTVTPATGAVLNAQGANANFTLPICGLVSAMLKVTDNLGLSTSQTRSINTTAMGPSISDITPSAATIGAIVTLTVKGQNLPLTAVLSVQDANCASPTNNTTTGFTQICTLGGPAASKTITVKTNTAANGGTVVDTTRSINVSSATSATGKLPDTGITASQCYAAGSDALVSCTSAAAIALNSKQDGMVGRDVSNPGSSDGKLGFSYSAVGSYTKEECVKDNITGLTWEGKPTSGARAASAGYTNYGDNRAGDASAYVAAVNAAKLCGYTDWRLPAKDELQGIVDYSVAYPGPAIDGTWFPNTQQSAYWTGTGYAGDSSGAWDVYFYNGYVDYSARYYHYHVRLVR